MRALSFSTLWKTAPLAIALVLLLGNCAPEAKYVSCENDAQCKDRGGDFRFCTMSHCVQCVGNSQCDNGKYCDEGSCVAHTARN